MLRRIFDNARYANVTATLALLVALSGTAYAAVAVTSREIRNGTIRGVDIAKGTITSSKLRDGTIKGIDVANNTITSAKIRDASLMIRDFKAGQGPAGPPGPAGPQGIPGVNAASSVLVRHAFSPAVIGAGDTATVTVLCAAGQRAVSGGTTNSSTVFDVRSSTPVAAAGAGDIPIGWRVEAVNVAGAPNTLQVFAICSGP